METDSESVGESLCYKQRLEKSTGAEMVMMKWSPVADLLAAAFTDHSVSPLIAQIIFRVFSFCIRSGGRLQGCSE